MTTARSNPNRSGRSLGGTKELEILLEFVLQPFIDRYLEPVYEELEECDDDVYELLANSDRLTNGVLALAGKLFRAVLDLLLGDGFDLQAAWFEREWTNVQRRRHKHRMQQVADRRRHRRRRRNRPQDPARQEYMRLWYLLRGKRRRRHRLRGSAAFGPAYCRHCGVSVA